MNEKFKCSAINNLFKAVMSLENIDECYDFFEDICTIAEIQEMAKRLTAAKMLSDGAKYNEIAEKFERVGAIEKTHEERYLTLLANVTDGKVFRKDETNVWVCRNCGHVYVGAEAPEVCPTCDHPKAYFELRAENY